MIEVPYFVGKNVIYKDSNDDPGIILLFYAMVMIIISNLHLVEQFISHVCQ